MSECQFDNVSVVCKANIYFDGRVISHSIVFADGTKKTLGLIYPGSYTFNTGAPEIMAIVAGTSKHARDAPLIQSDLKRRAPTPAPLPSPS